MRFYLRIDRERCKGCELCAWACPEDVLAMSEEMNSRGQHFPDVMKPDSCTGCGRCALMCPDAAIEIEAEDD